MAATARKQMGALDGEVTACAAAAAVLVECPYWDHYPAGFDVELQGATGEVRTGDGWLAACAEICGDAEPSPAQVYFSLVLLDPDFANRFRRSMPRGSGFERHLTQFADSLDYARAQVWAGAVGAGPTEQDRREDPSIARAIDSGKASVALVARARWNMSPLSDDETSRPRYERLYPAVLAAFEQQHGRVVSDFWCRSFPAGMIRTERGRLHLVINEFPQEIVPITDSCEEVFRDIDEYLQGREKELLADDVWAVLTRVYGDLNRAAKEQGRPPRLGADDVARHRADLEDTRGQARERMKRHAQRSYILGTFLGVVALGGLFAILSAFATGNWARLFEGAVFGAAGALASVLFRMQRNKLRLNPRQGMRLIAVAALVRPLMGGLFGAITIAVLLSGLLPIEVSSVEPDRFYFLGTLAFIAGFSERWAPNLLELAGQQAAVNNKKGPEEKPDSS